MSINEIFPMRKRRSINKTPGKTPGRSSTTSTEVRVPQQTPKRITSNSSFSECEIVWDNHSPSPSRTLLGKRKKTAFSDGSSSDNNDIADMVKKLADKTGQTPQDSSLYNFWFDGQESNPVDKVTSGDKKKQLQTPARRSRVLRKGRKSKNRLSKELEVLASMMQNTENNGNMNHAINDVSPSSKKTFEATSPLRSYQQSMAKPTRIENSNKTATPTEHYQDIKKHKSTITPKYSSPVSDIVDIDWGDDDDVDDMLSQVDISALVDQEVVTNTQRSDIEQSEALSLKENKNTSTNDDSFVTESWDFDDDSDELILTLEQVERIQSVASVPDIKPIRQNNKEQSNIAAAKEEQSKTIQAKSVCSKEDIERKKLEAQQKRKQRLKLQNNRPNTRQSTYRSRR